MKRKKTKSIPVIRPQSTIDWFMEKYGRPPSTILERVEINVMDSLKYKRTEVIAKLKENREKHEAAYQDASEGFHEAVVKELAEALKLAKAGTEFRLTLKQKEPVSYLKHYDRAIKMFEMSSQEEVELSEHEFTQYVMDEWNWKDAFIGSARTYGKGAY